MPRLRHARCGHRVDISKPSYPARCEETRLADQAFVMRSRILSSLELKAARLNRRLAAIALSAIRARRAGSAIRRRVLAARPSKSSQRNPLTPLCTVSGRPPELITTGTAPADIAST